MTISLVPTATKTPETQTVTDIVHWTDELFSFRLSRPSSLRFRSGEFIMLGLPDENGRPIMRAYSIASPAWDDTLEFYSIKVPEGPLTSRLQHIKPGDKVILRTKPVGTLVLDALLPGKRLYLIATGTGIAPFASLLRDPETYERYEEIILTHTCAQKHDLQYGEHLVAQLPSDPLIGEYVQDRFHYVATTTREHSANTGRITSWIANGTLSAHLNLPELDPQTDRVMICGSVGLNRDVRDLLTERHFIEGTNSVPAHFVVEKAFVD